MTETGFEIKMRKLFLTFLTLFFFIESPAQDTQEMIPVKEIEFFGVKETSQRNVQRWFNLKKGDDFNADQEIAELTRKAKSKRR